MYVMPLPNASPYIMKFSFGKNLFDAGQFNSHTVAILPGCLGPDRSPCCSELRDLQPGSFDRSFRLPCYEWISVFSAKPNLKYWRVAMCSFMIASTVAVDRINVSPSSLEVSASVSSSAMIAQTIARRWCVVDSVIHEPLHTDTSPCGSGGVFTAGR